MDSLTNSNFKVVAEKYYDNPQCFSYVEFEEDIKRFQSVSRLLSRYTNTYENARLMLNHIIILHNTFGKFAVYGLFFKVTPDKWETLKTFLHFLQLIPQSHPSFDLNDDIEILNLLRDL